jgi:integrase
MAKRANGEGSISKREDGRWTARISLPGGKRKDFYGKTRAEVAEKLAAATKQRTDGLPFVKEKQTVEDFLNSWLEASRSSIRDRTYETYETILRIHVTPFVGKKRLARLAPLDLQKLYGERLTAGLSAASVRKVHSIVHRALEQAVRWELVVRNVADLVTPPRIGHRDMTTLSPAQARKLLDIVQADRLGALYVLAITTGMRLGELLALRWKDVDLTDGSLSVRGTLYRAADGLVIGEPKTSGSRRKISLGVSAVEALRSHKVNQNAERLLAGKWEDNGLVFSNEVGRPIEDTNLRRRSFEPLLVKADLPRIRFHDLRHTAATLLLAQGVHPKIVSERLGHSRVSITLDLYSHVTPTMQRQAAEAMESILQGQS